MTGREPTELLLERPGVLRIARGALARAGWYMLGKPAVWCLHHHEREYARWGGTMYGDESPVTARKLVEEMDDDVFGARFDALYNALQAAGASSMRHVKKGASFGDHLVDVARLLRVFRGKEGSLVLAGLGHTCYGSELFPAPLASLADRGDMRRALGPERRSACSTSTPPPARSDGTVRCSDVIHTAWRTSEKMPKNALTPDGTALKGHNVGPQPRTSTPGRRRRCTAASARR